MNTQLPDTLYAAGKWMLDLRRVPQALDLFRAMVVSAPGDERSWLGLGACHELLEQDDVALELYDMAVAAAGGARCHVARARLLRKLGRDSEAEDALDRAEAAADDPDVEAIVAYERRAA